MVEPPLPEDSAADAEPFDAGGATLTLLSAAEVQDHLMSVSNDLERLQRLLDDAGETLSTHFFQAIIALQFQDMSTQLIAHTSLRLRASADMMARDAFGDDEDGAAAVVEAPLRPNPVTQDEVDAGSVELF
jgi:hypothetical protein